MTVKTTLGKFFGSNAIKNIFDNIRNLGLSTAVLIAGNYLFVTISPDSNSPWIPLILGRTLIVCGFLLLALCVSHGYYLLKETGISAIVARLISFIYGLLAVVFFLTLLRSKGITVG